MSLKTCFPLFLIIIDNNNYVIVQAELSEQGDDFTRQIWQMYATFEDFLEHQQQQHPPVSPVGDTRGDTPPPPPAPHSATPPKLVSGGLGWDKYMGRGRYTWLV